MSAVCSEALRVNPNERPLQPNICFPSHKVTPDNQRDTFPRCYLSFFPDLFFSPLSATNESLFLTFALFLLHCSASMYRSAKGCSYNLVVFVCYPPSVENPVVTGWRFESCCEQKTQRKREHSPEKLWGNESASVNKYFGKPLVFLYIILVKCKYVHPSLSSVLTCWKSESKLLWIFMTANLLPLKVRFGFPIECQRRRGAEPNGCPSRWRRPNSGATSLSSAPGVAAQVKAPF